MTVYLDVLIVLNIYISYFILKSASRLFHIDYSFKRIALASVVGGFSSMAAVFDTGFFLSLIIKAAVTALIVFISFGYKGIKAFFRNVSVCTALGMLLSGITIFIHEICGSDFVFSANGYVYIDISALVLVISSAVIYGIMTVLRRILDSPETDGRVKLTIKNNGSSAELSAFRDSGNCLFDFLTGLPVVLCKEDKIKSVLPESVEQYLSGSTDNMSGIRIIPIRTAGGEGVITAFRPEKVTADINGIEKDITVLIGVRKDALKNESFDAVISPKLLI